MSPFPRLSNSALSRWNAAVTNMVLLAHGEAATETRTSSDGPYQVGGMIYTEDSAYGVTIQDVMIDSTTDNPAQPYENESSSEPDIEIHYTSNFFQIVDSTFIGAGVAGSFGDSLIDNCRFVGCGYGNAQLDSQHSAQLSVARCTVTSLVNNVLCPGGNVENDAAYHFFVSTVSDGAIYVGDNTTSGLYHAANQGDGEHISIEPDTFGDEKYNQDVAVYQNTLSGDGKLSLAASHGLDTIGISVDPGYNIVVADNDVSNVGLGLYFYDQGDVATHMPFAMVTDNSVQHCGTGMQLFVGLPTDQQNTPWFIGCSFNDNVFSGGIDGSAGILINVFAGQSDILPQILMNIFNADVVTGVATTLILKTYEASPANEVGTIVVSNGFLSSDGSAQSSLEADASGDLSNPVRFPGTFWQGFWDVSSV